MRPRVSSCPALSANIFPELSFHSRSLSFDTIHEADTETVSSLTGTYAQVSPYSPILLDPVVPQDVIIAQDSLEFLRRLPRRKLEPILRGVRERVFGDEQVFWIRDWETGQSLVLNVSDLLQLVRTIDQREEDEEHIYATIPDIVAPFEIGETEIPKKKSKKVWIFALAAGLLTLAAILAIIIAVVLKGSGENIPEHNATIEIEWLKTSQEITLGWTCPNLHLYEQQAPASLTLDGIHNRFLLTYQSAEMESNESCSPANLTLLSLEVDSFSAKERFHANIDILEDGEILWCQGGSLSSDLTNYYCVDHMVDPTLTGYIDDLSFIRLSSTPCGMWILGENQTWFCSYQDSFPPGDGTVNIFNARSNTFKLLRPFETCQYCQIMAIGAFESQKLGALWIQISDFSVFLAEYGLNSAASSSVIAAKTYFNFSQFPDPADLYPNVTDVVLAEKYRLFEWNQNDWLIVRLMQWCLNYSTDDHFPANCVQIRKSLSFGVYDGETGDENGKSDEIYLDKLGQNVYPADFDLNLNNGEPYMWQKLSRLNPDSEIVLIDTKLYILFQTNFSFQKSVLGRAVVAVFDVKLT